MRYKRPEVHYAFNRIALIDHILYCNHCETDTAQELISFDGFTSIIETRCNQCKQAIKVDTSEKYCDVCKEYTHFQLYNEKIEGDWGIDTFRCKKCEKGVYEEKTYCG